MKRKMGAIVSIALTLALVLSLATTALAGSENGSKGSKPMGGQLSTSANEALKKNMPWFGQSVNNKPESNPSLANGAPEEAIAALSAEDKETLKEYIDAYEDAVSEAIAAMETAQKGDDLSKYRESVMTALKNLLKAAKDAGINLKTSMSSVASMNGQLNRNWNGKDFTDTVEEALAALSDEDKETLSDFIEAYEAALAEAEEAKENAEDGDDLSASHEAVLTALKELLEAAKEANIDLGLKSFPAVLKDEKNLNCPIGSHFTKAVVAAIAALDDDDKDTLSVYIEAYEDAIAEAEAAAEIADEDDDLSDYREAVVAALRELLEAAKEADIDLGLLKTKGR